MRIFLSCLCGLLLMLPSLATAQKLGDGSELEFGGPGAGEGTFGEVRDITFGPGNELYVLDGGQFRDGAAQGNFLVQVFDNDGKFLRQFSIRDTALGDRANPQRLAVDSRGFVYITEPNAGLVRRYDANGRHNRDFEVPHAFAITTRMLNRREQILVATNQRNQPTQQLLVIDAVRGQLMRPLPLQQPVQGITDITADSQGRIYLQAHQNQIYLFERDGKLRTVLGGGTFTRVEDGSELMHTVAVDSKGHIYSLTPGNPGLATCFDPDLKLMKQRPAQFYWFDAWNPHSQYTIFAIDANDRLWVAATGKVERGVRHHYRPAIIRTQPDYFERNSRQSSTLLLGLRSKIEVSLPHHIGYELSPTDITFVVMPAHRRVQQVQVQWRVHDIHKTTIAEGKFDLPLTDGQEARSTFTFTPPKWGWYTVECQLIHEGERLRGMGAHLGFTPQYPGMYTLTEQDQPGGWNDIRRTAFAGLGIHRINTSSIEAIETALAEAEAHGITLLVQFQDRNAAEPDKVREVVTQLKNKVKHWEVINEPDLSMSAEEYARRLAAASAVIREVDPDAKIMGPASCGIKLDWIDRFLQEGGGKNIDILSVHDYEGHESIDPVHWQWKLGALRELMRKHGIGDMPIWQTERGIPGVRANIFLGGAQAVRVLLQRDLLEAAGIPNNRNFYYYLNQGGYAAYPGYIWSNVGPHPAVLALRTRQAMIQGREYREKLDLGPTGNKFLLALRYEGPDGTTISLRNYGMMPQPVEVRVDGAAQLEVVDSFGNVTQVPVTDGRATVEAPQLPVYLRVPAGQTLTIPPIDLGTNLASKAKLAYSGETDRDLARLVDGVMSTTHHGHPHGGPNNPHGWVGKAETWPQAIELQWPQAQRISDVLLFGQRADNTFSALLDVDVQYYNGRRWVTVAEIRTHCPVSDPVETPQSHANTWYMDENIIRARFEPIRTDRLRIVVHRITQGLVPDIEGTRYGESRPGGDQLQLRQIEVYGP